MKLKMKKGYALSRACPQASVFVFKFQISKFIFVALQLALYPVGFFFRLSLACEKFFFLVPFLVFILLCVFFFDPQSGHVVSQVGVCVFISYYDLRIFFSNCQVLFDFFQIFFCQHVPYAPRIFRVFVIRFPILCLCLHVSAQHFFFSLSFSTHMSHHHTHMSHHHTCFCPTLFLLSLFLQYV